jgi:hypothetical protein
MDIVGEGLAACQEWLAAQKLAREQYYYDLAFFPERFETPEETPAPTEPSIEETLPNAA